MCIQALARCIKARLFDGAMDNCTNHNSINVHCGRFLTAPAIAGARQ